MDPPKSLKGAWATSPIALNPTDRDFDGVAGLEPHSLSLPGFKNFLIPHISLLRRTLWVVVFGVTIILCAFQVSRRVQFFMLYPVSTSFALTSKQTATFPTVTLCMFNPHVSNRFYSYINKTEYCMADVYNLLKQPGMTLEDIWEMSTDDMNEFIVDCQFGKKSCMKPEYWSMENNVAGRCHVLHINDDVPYIGIETNMTLTIRDLPLLKHVPDANKYIMFKFLIHDRYLNKKYGSFMQGESIYGNSWASYKYGEREFTYENTPVNPCVQPDAYADCIQACYEEQFYRNKPKCRLPFTVDGLHYPPCTYKEFIEVYNFTLIDTFERIDPSECNYCVRPCHDVHYRIFDDLRFENKEGYSTIIIYPPAYVEHMTESRAYSSTSLASDIGGALGLFLGACILSFFEVVNLTFQVVVQRIR